MTVAELIAKRRKQLSDILTKNIPFQKAVFSTIEKQSKRIFIEGQNSAGGKIGQYDTTTPFYVNPDKAPAAEKSRKKFPTEGLKPTKGKTGEHTFQNGKEHKTTFVNNYKDFRNRIGRRIDFVNLDLSTELKSDFDSGIYRTNPHTYFVRLKREGSKDKLEGNEKRFGTIFRLTESEKENFNRILQLELSLVLNA